MHINDDFFIPSSKPIFNECLIDGNRIVYDGCGSESLKKSIDFYADFGSSPWIYMGSGNITWHNGVKNIWDDPHHFFIKPHRLRELRTMKLKHIDSHMKNRI